MHRVPSSCPRLLINLESVGEIEHPRSSIGFDFEGKSGKPIRDVRKLAKADEAFEELCELLGWADELRAVREEGWRALDGDGDGDAPAGRATEETPEERQKEVLAAVDAKLEPKAAEPEQDQDRDVDALAQAVSEVELNKPEARPPGVDETDETDEHKKAETEAPAASAKKATL